MNRLSLLGLVLLGAACGPVSAPSELKLRQLTVSEAKADLHELVNSVASLYGPLEYKQERFGYTLAQLAEEAEARLDEATTDEEILGVYTKFLARFDDSHVSIRFRTSTLGVRAYSIPIFVVPVEDKTVVSSVGDTLADMGIQVGDQLLTVDGKTMDELFAVISQYQGLANPISARHAIYMALSRPSFMTELRPTSAVADLEFARPDGSEYTVNIAWHEKPYAQNLELVSQSPSSRITQGYEVAFGAELNQRTGLDVIGNDYPFFLSGPVQSSFGLVQVEANADFKRTYGLDPAKSPFIYSAMYKYQGSTILLVRQPRYSNSIESQGFSNADYMKAYRAVLDQYDDFADVLVVDQTHNGGGSYCEDFFRLFINEPEGGFVQKCNADRKWVIDFNDWAAEVDPTLTSEASRLIANFSRETERAYDAGEPLTTPIALMSGQNLVQPDSGYTWKKKFIVLTDELSFSCADAFPALIKNNGVAPIFGERTNGAGGNIEPVVELTNSRASVRLTRGLFTTYKADGNYVPADFIENNGVQPDQHYSHSYNDFLSGYVGYVDAFSKYAVGQLSN